MKICPACQTQYSDDTLQFCLQDGTPLGSGPITETPTVVLGETETVAARRGSEWQQNQVTHVATLQPQKKGSYTVIAVAATAIGMFLLFGVVGIGAWLFFRNSQQPAVQNTANTANIPGGTVSDNSLSTPLPYPTPTRSTDVPVPANTGTSPPVDTTQSRTEVSQRIYSWKSQAESLDLNSYMAHYAGTVDYYRKPGASAAFVRADKMRAFSRYSSIKINISNMSVTTDPSGVEATATLDKEWDFQGNGSSQGKVRQMLQFRKINGQWLITAEKDLKVYYVR